MRTSLAASQDEVRRYNLGAVLQRLHIGGPVSRSELVALTGLNRSTVGALVAELAEQGLVIEAPGSAGSVGRPSLMVMPQPRSAIVLAFDFRVDRTVGAIVGLGGETISRVERSRQRSEFAPDLSVAQLIDMAHELLEEVPEETLWVGTGVGVPGIVNERTGVVSQAPNLGWIDVPFAQMVTDALRKEFGEVPTTVTSNDADLGALAEHTRGAAVDSGNVIYVSGEVGIGGGVVLGGALMTGAGGFGGEIGHMIVNPAGIECRCGSRGCWETVIGRGAVLSCIQDSNSVGDVQDVIDAALAGDAVVQERLASVGRWLGIGLVNLINIFNPEVIVLGGHLGQLYPVVAEEVNEQIGHALRAPREQARIALPVLGEDSTLIGASESAFASLLSRPMEAVSESSTFIAAL
jgi:predicted NBD/HSP70 family sugar kinase